MQLNWNKFYNKVYDWVIIYAPKILLAIIVIIIGLWAIKMFSRFLKNTFEKRSFNPSLKYFLQNLIITALRIILIVIAFQIAGIELTFLTAIMAGLTVAAGLALSGTLQNFVSGIIILLLKPYRVGDNIVTQDQEGKVTSIDLFYTVVLTEDNKTIIIPNGQLSNNVVVNLSKQGNRRLDIALKLNYGIDYNIVKKILEDSMASAAYILEEPRASIGVNALEPDRYTIAIEVWVDANTYADNKLVLQEKIMNDLKANGVKLPGMA
jgi:small conductance mechanosensitive channel